LVVEATVVELLKYLVVRCSFGTFQLARASNQRQVWLMKFSYEEQTSFRLRTSNVRSVKARGPKNLDRATKLKRKALETWQHTEILCDALHHLK
jgi:hypothetical protein